MGDFSLNVLNKSEYLIKELKEQGIEERITGRHGKFGAPNTFRHRTNTINGIFATDNIEVV